MGLIQMSVAGTILIIIIAAVRAATRNHLPKMTYMAMWYLAVIRLLLPFSLEFSFSFYTLFPRLFPKTGNGRPAVMEPTQLLLPAYTVSKGTTAVKTGSDIPVTAIIWLLGFFILAMYFAVSYFAGVRKFSISLPVNNNFADQWLKEQKCFRNVEIRVSDRIAAPLTYGILKPRILLPKGTDWKNEDALCYILTHEHIHIKRLDAAVKIALAAVLCLHWFNPAVWLMYILANRDMELSCDEMVVNKLGEPVKSSYAMTLIHMEEIKMGGSRLNIHFSKNAIEERIKAIMKIKKIPVINTFLAAMLVLLMAVLFGTSAAASGEENTFRAVWPVLDICKNWTNKWETSKPEANKPEVDLSEKEKQEFVWPAQSCTLVTSWFGEMTALGINIDYITVSSQETDPKGSSVYAVLDGMVAFAGFDTDNGNYVVINHENGLQTVYAHCDTLRVKEGDTVTQGTVIATLGKTGKVTGACLAFRVYQDGKACDPMLYFPSDVLEAVSYAK